MFDLDQFVADCVEAGTEANPVLAVKEILDRAIARPADLADTLPATVAEFCPLYTSADISIFKFVWGPAMSVPPHDHLMWAINGIYGGVEDNVFYRRTDDRIVQSGGRRVTTAQTAMLGAEVIHAVTNPSPCACTGSIHIYGGDYLRKTRSVWDPETLEEGPADGGTMRRMFEEARAKPVSGAPGSGGGALGPLGPRRDPRA
jgi:predicted metal-dependent enzyme (double-stranded beta helix superfamily)